MSRSDISVGDHILYRRGKESFNALVCQVLRIFRDATQVPSGPPAVSLVYVLSGAEVNSLGPESAVRYVDFVRRKDDPSRADGEAWWEKRVTKGKRRPGTKET